MSRSATACESSCVTIHEIRNTFALNTAQISNPCFAYIHSLIPHNRHPEDTAVYQSSDSRIVFHDNRDLEISVIRREPLFLIMIFEISIDQIKVPRRSFNQNLEDFFHLNIPMSLNAGAIYKSCNLEPTIPVNFDMLLYFVVKRRHRKDKPFSRSTNNQRCLILPIHQSRATHLLDILLFSSLLHHLNLHPHNNSNTILEVCYVYIFHAQLLLLSLTT